jgi:hypothetical protein
MSSVVCPNPIGLNVVVVEIRQVVSVGFRKMVRTDPLPGRNIRVVCIVMSGGNRGVFVVWPVSLTVVVCLNVDCSGATSVWSGQKNRVGSVSGN